MIRIRYWDLPSGVHARAQDAGRSTTIYLQPGLTGPQRKAAIRRLRQEGRMGCGPSLPRARLAVACAVDRARCAACQLAAIVRLHPIGILLPVLLLIVMTALFLRISATSSLPAPAGHEGAGQSPGARAVSPQLVATMLGRSQGRRDDASMLIMPALVSRAPAAPSR